MSRSSLLASLVLPLAACGSDSPVVNVEPEPDPPADTTPDVRRASLSIRVVPTEADVGVATALGWTAGVPGATVEIRRDGGSATITATTDATGHASFEELLEGGYAITASRLLSEDERAQLAAGDQEVDAFGGGSYVSVSPPNTDGTVTLDAGRPGSLVISELHFPNSTFPSGETYRMDAFLEVYNNSDTTISLGGLLVGVGWDRAVDAGVAPCSNYRDVLEDAGGVWFRYLYRFPGGPTAHRLGAGQAAVLAIDAIDHREILSTSIDLSSADFEYVGSGDVDNPGVPNMESVGVAVDFPVPLGHGLHISSWVALPFVATRGDVQSFETKVVDVGGFPVELWRMPRERLVDVAQFLQAPADIPLCNRIVHPEIDRGAKDPGENTGGRSVQRTVLRRLPSGRAILLRTRTSARDFEVRAPTPGVIPQ